jgi:hypothetical protein
MHRNLAGCVSIHTYMHYIRTYGCVSTGYAYSYTKTQVIYLSLQHRKSTEAQRPHGAQELRAVSAFRTAPAAQSFTTYKVIMSLGMYMYVNVVSEGGPDCAPSDSVREPIRKKTLSGVQNYNQGINVFLSGQPLKQHRRAPSEGFSRLRSRSWHIYFSDNKSEGPFRPLPPSCDR